MVFDRRLIAKGLMGSFEVVFNKPFGELLVEDLAVRCHASHLDELLIESPVEPFIKGIVGRSPRTGEIMGEMEDVRGLTEVLRELRTVVGLDILDSSVKQVMEPFQEVGGVGRVMGRIHSGEGDLGMSVDAGEDIPFHAIHIPDDGVHRHEKSFALLFLELGNALLGLIGPAFLPQQEVPLRMKVEVVFFDHSLDLP